MASRGGHATVAHSQFCVAERHWGPSGWFLGQRSLGPWDLVGDTSSSRDQNISLKKKAEITCVRRGREG